MKYIEDIEVEGRKILLRTDLNLPVEDGEPRKTVRFDRYLETVEELLERGAKLTVMAHQGRPAREDFLSLEKHAELLSESLEREVEFIPGFFGDQIEKVERLGDGEIALIENIRFLSEELQNVSPERHADDFFVDHLASYFDVYVNDAFSAAHRSHGSLVGFAPRLESCGGPVMRQELENLGRIREKFEGGVLVLGGEKPADIIGMIEQVVEDVEKILLAGIPGELGLLIEGHNLGKKGEWIREKGLDSNREELERILEEHREKILLPEDVETESGNHEVGNVPPEMIWDIGEHTRERFEEEILNADQVLMKGPPGAFEQGHEEGTRTVIDAVAETDAFTVIGGGHTSSLVQRYNHSLEDFSHVSIAGGAFVRFMSGEDLPAVQALEEFE